MGPEHSPLHLLKACLWLHPELAPPLHTSTHQDQLQYSFLLAMKLANQNVSIFGFSITWYMLQYQDFFKKIGDNMNLWQIPGTGYSYCRDYN
jgi:hypothetical protein